MSDFVKSYLRYIQQICFQICETSIPSPYIVLVYTRLEHTIAHCCIQGEHVYIC